MNDLRTKEIKIRLSESEFLTLHKLKTKSRLAEWLREIALNQKPNRRIKPVDPNLLYQLNKISTNINQIAKQCNIQKNNIDLIAITVSLNRIENNLNELVNNY